MEEKERQKAEAKAKEAEAAEAAKKSARAAISSLLPSKLFGNKDSDTESAETKQTEAESAEANGNVIEATFVNEEGQAGQEGSSSEIAPVDAVGESADETVTEAVGFRWYSSKK
jgi:hypothetical protein